MCSLSHPTLLSLEEKSADEEGLCGSEEEGEGGQLDIDTFISLLRCSIQGVDFISTPEMLNPRSGFYIHS